MHSVASIANSEKSLHGMKSPAYAQIKPAKSAFLTNEVKGEELSEEESLMLNSEENPKSNKKGKSAHVASNYSD